MRERIPMTVETWSPCTVVGRRRHGGRHRWRRWPRNLVENPLDRKWSTPKGPVRQVIFKNCTSCHGIDDYAYNALDRAGWNALIETKHKGLNVPISDKDRDLVLDWVVAKFGPDSRPFPRAYVPPEITTFFSDSEAQALLARACTTCHGLDRVNERGTAPTGGESSRWT